MIRNLIFDFGKVLVDYDFPSVIHSFFEGQAPGREEEFYDFLIKEDWQSISDREAKPLPEFYEEMRQRYPQFATEITRMDSEFQRFIIGEIPGMREVLAKLKAAGYHLYGLSNWSSKVYQTMERFPEIFSYLEGSVISSEVHLLKPEPEIYQALLEKFSLDASECLFADDRPENIEGCRAVGMKGVVFTTTEAYIEDLKRFGIEI